MMTIDQAIPAVVHIVGTVIAREITSITTACHSTISYLHPFSSIVAKHFMEISVPICKPFLHDLASGALSLFRFHFGVSFSRIIVLYISLSSECSTPRASDDDAHTMEWVIDDKPVWSSLQ